MRRLVVFNNISLDGFFTGVDGDFSWAHGGMDDPDFRAFAARNASGGGVLLFGRITYEFMASYWTTPVAKQNDPKVAEGMNRMPKVVFSRTLTHTSWANSQIVGNHIVTAVRKMKQEEGPGMAILGSGSIVAQLAPEHLIDEYQFVVNPVVLGRGRSQFEGMKQRLNLTLIESRTFRNGRVYLSYQPAV